MVPGQDHEYFHVGKVFHRGLGVLGKIGFIWVTIWRDEDNLSVELQAGVKFLKFYSILHAREKLLRDYFKDSFRARRRITVRLDTETASGYRSLICE